MRDEQPRRHAVADFGGVADFSAQILRRFFLGDDFDIQRSPACGVLQRPHDLLHVGFDVRDALSPIFRRFDRALGPLRITHDEEV